MRIEIDLVLKDDDGNTIDKRTAFTPNVTTRELTVVIADIVRWVTENVCSLVTSAKMKH